ncbi:unnamed protein product [Xylocopa violacea]|uniref:Uncharacterized protein n=1 Tax=Xylocopa violacea TaxID=135666 RepID=A0ABP1PBS1_XYLVO
MQRLLLYAMTGEPKCPVSLEKRDWIKRAMATKIYGNACRCMLLLEFRDLQCLSGSTFQAGLLAARVIIGRRAEMLRRLAARTYLDTVLRRILRQFTQSFTEPARWANGILRNEQEEEDARNMADIGSPTLAFFRFVLARLNENERREASRSPRVPRERYHFTWWKEHGETYVLSGDGIASVLTNRGQLLVRRRRCIRKPYRPVQSVCTAVHDELELHSTTLNLEALDVPGLLSRDTLPPFGITTVSILTTILNRLCRSRVLEDSLENALVGLFGREGDKSWLVRTSTTVIVHDEIPGSTGTWGLLFFTSLNTSVHPGADHYFLFSSFSFRYRLGSLVPLDAPQPVRVTKTSSFFVRSPRTFLQDQQRSRECTVHHSITLNERPAFLDEELSLEHHKEAVVQFLDASCFTLPVRFQECATPRLQ